MKKMVLFIVIIGLNLSLSAQKRVLIPSFTIGAMQDLNKDYNGDHLISKKNILMYPVEVINGEYFIGVLARTNGNFDLNLALERNFKVGAVIGNVASMKIPLAEFNLNFSFPGIDYLETSVRMDPYLDGAVPDARADSVHQGINLLQSYTGRNVLIGVVDWGFEYVHPTFYDTNMTTHRVVAAWDQVKTGTPPNGFTYGNLYDNTAALLAAERDTFSIVSNTHGTHVAGIAGGGGAGTPYRGVGFDAEFLFTQMNGHATYSLDAYQWMYNMSKSLGKRLVINNSFGTYRDNPLDGTSLYSQAIEAYIDSGVVFAISAANNGGVPFHIKKIFNNDSIRTRVAGFNYGTDADLWGQTITSWGEPGEDYSCRIRILGSSGQQVLITPWFNTGTSPAYIDTFMVTGVDTVWYKVKIDANHPLNNRTQMSFDIKMPNPSHKCILIAEAPSGTVHFWNTRKTIFGGGNWGYGFTTYGSGYTTGDDNYGIGHPSVTTGVISVAAHTTNGGITSFSSHGPRMDEYPKPDISAPGSNIASSLNSGDPGSYTPVTTVNFLGNNYDFVRFSGTSMACPMTVGVISLILEARPNITPEQVKELIATTAYTDNFTGTITAPGSSVWGWGKLNAYAAVQNSFTVSVPTSQTENNLQIFPNPGNEMLFIIGEEEVDFEMIGLDGKLCLKGKASQQINVSSLSPGTYILRLNNKENTSIFKWIKM